MDKNKEFVIDCIKELVKEMKENCDLVHSNSYEYNNAYIHFRLLDVTDYEHEHYGYSIDIKVSNPDSGDIITECEVFYNDMKNLFEVKTKKSIDVNELLEDLNRISKRPKIEFDEEEFRNVLDGIVECMKETKLDPIRTECKEPSTSSLYNVLVVKEESSIGGGLRHVGSFVRVYAFRGTFDTYENFKKFIYNNSDISTYWSVADSEERDSELMNLYNEIISKDKANKEFPLYWESGLTNINMSFHVISDIKDGSYIELDTVNFE